MQKAVKVSIIMPAYNKYHHLKLSFEGLLRQNFPASQFEVILMDDCSTDRTGILVEEWKDRIPIVYRKLDRNRGRSHARNAGIGEAKGEVLLFLDSEMLVEPHFISNHFRHHENSENSVVSGGIYYFQLFSHLYPDFSSKQQAQMEKIVLTSSYLERVKEAKLNLLDTPFQIVRSDEIENGQFKQLCFPNFYFLDKGLRSFEQEMSEFRLPYLAFLSGNVSVKKEMLKKSGYFDESFVGYGAEDWELGYRLYKNGVAFILDPETAAYHQEHPVSERKYHEAIENHLRFIEKHPNLDTLILSLEYYGFTFLHMHHALTEADQIEKNSPVKYRELLALFKDMLKLAVLSLKDPSQVKKNKRKTTHFDQSIYLQLNSLKEEGYIYLSGSIEPMMKKFG